MEILHTSNIIKSKLDFIDVDLEDINKRNKYAQKTPTATLPFLETKNGNISESKSIEIYLANKYKPDILGNNIFEKSKINQWIEFANCEIQNCINELIYPIFKGKKKEKKGNENEDKKLKKYLNILEKEFNKGNKYIIGNNITLADIVLFRYLRLIMMFYLPEKIRNILCPKLTKWFENIMNTQEAINAYGRTILCKKQLKPLDINNEIQKKASKFDINNFKQDFMNNKNKKNIMEKFWKEFDSKGYSLWKIEYKNLEKEGKSLFRMKNSKNFFLERIDEDFKKYSFGIHGVYENNNEYKVIGLWIWKGEIIPDEIKNNDYFNYLIIQKLNNENNNDKKLVEDYLIKCNKGDIVDNRKVEECTYFY